jgi:hypothetical protein
MRCVRAPHRRLAVSRQYLQQVSYRGFTLAEWLFSTPESPGASRHRWDVVDSSGKVLQTFSDRAHAESYVDHHAAT